jgi:hypothetical protein
MPTERLTISNRNAHAAKRNPIGKVDIDPSSARRIFKLSSTHVIESIGYRGIYNGIALLILIAGVALVFSRGVRLFLLMFASLTLLAILTMSFNIYIFGYFD